MSGSTTAPTPSTPGSTGRTGPPDSPELTALRGRWSEVSRHLLTGGLPLLAAAWGEAKATALRGDQLTIEVPARRQALLSDADQQGFLLSSIAAVAGGRFRLLVRVAGTTDDQPLDDRAQRYRAAEAHPLVKELMQRFQAELVGRELVDLESWLTRLTESNSRGSRPVVTGGSAEDEAL